MDLDLETHVEAKLLNLFQTAQLIPKLVRLFLIQDLVDTDTKDALMKRAFY